MRPLSSTEKISSNRAVSETLGVAVLVGMTVLVTASLGAGVMIVAEQDAEQTADIGFTHLGDRLVIEYADEDDRAAGNLYVDGPDNNVTWAGISDDLGPEDAVTEGTFLEVGPETAYGSGVQDDDTFDIVYFTEDGERFVLATWNEVEDEDPLADDDDPPDPDGF